MMKSTGRLKVLGFASVALMALTAVAPQAIAAPFATAGSSDVVAENLVEQVQVRRAKPVKRPVQARSRARNNNAAIGAAIGIGILGIAAAAAASQRNDRRGVYYTDQWGNPVDAYGRPVYGSRNVQYHQQPRGFYQEPGFYQQSPGYYRDDRNGRWEQQRLRQREEARRAEQREAIRRQRAEQDRWAQQRQRNQPVYPGYLNPSQRQHGFGHLQVDPRGHLERNLP